MVVSSALYFSVRADGTTFRRWRMGTVEIEVTESPIKIRLCGGGRFGSSTATMTTDDDDYEIFEDGDELPRDWEEQGIDFGTIIQKWLRRLNGDQGKTLCPTAVFSRSMLRRWRISASRYCLTTSL